jgi:hypothetical protein
MLDELVVPSRCRSHWPHAHVAVRRGAGGSAVTGAAAGGNAEAKQHIPIIVSLIWYLVSFAEVNTYSLRDSAF